MKKSQIVMFIVTLVMCLGLCAVTALADNSDFVIEDGVLVEYTGKGGDVVIPDGVVEIDEHAFDLCKDEVPAIVGYGVPVRPPFGLYTLTSVVIPDGIKIIDDYAFSHCESLTSVTISDSVTTIGNYAFESCKSLTSIIIPNGVTTIGGNAFYNCEGLTTVSLGANVNDIYADDIVGTFRNCTNLTEFNVSSSNPYYMAEDGVLFTENKDSLVFYPPGKKGAYIIPVGVKTISDYAFFNCENLTSITFPSSITTIGYSAFRYCNKLTSLSIPARVKEISADAFANCEGLTSVTIPDNVISLEGGAFMGCTGLIDVDIGTGVTALESFIFSDCTSLTQVNIPNGVTTIEPYAFSGCNSLTKVIIPDSVTDIDIEGHAFSSCPSLIEFIVSASSKYYTSIGGVLFTKDMKTLVSYPSGKSGSYSIPDGVEIIGYSAFEGDNVTDVYIPSNVSKIDKHAFASCKKLIIYGETGSYAETFASDVGWYGFESLRRFHPVPFVASKIPNTACTSTQSININGTPVEFQMYALVFDDGGITNYIKVRDLAYVLDNTEAKFNVTWDGSVNLVPGAKYEPNGSEMSTPYSGNRDYKKATAATKVDGKKVNIDAIMLTDDKGGGYTYYKLRDLGQTLGFNVGWEANTGVYIETTKPYIG